MIERLQKYHIPLDSMYGSLLLTLEKFCHLGLLILGMDQLYFSH